jgi:glucosamine--fructose-6-phosphate aminotransferase (isomerizing)
MCGIFGIVTDKEQTLGPILVEAARRLTYRGYDSVGAATISGAHIDLRKDAGRVDDVARKYNFAEMTGQRGITQLRWATFGEPSQVNSQPHLDSDGDLVGAHNGNVVNNVELREAFMAEGMTVRSHNDGESCVHAVERYVDQGKDFIEAIRLAYGDLQGDYAFVIGRINDDCLYAIKKGSGLVVGIGDGFTCVSSDLPSILPLTRQVIRLNDGEIITLRADRVELHSVKDGSRIQRAPETITEEMSAVQKGSFAHFMLKEIHEQPQVAREVLHLLENSAAVPTILEKIQAARQVYFIGCGTSYHACLAGAVYFAQLAKRAVTPVRATVRASGQPRGRGHLRQPVGRDQGRAQRAGEGSGRRDDLLCPGQRDRLYPHPCRVGLAAAGLRLRDQRARHQDLHQPGDHLPVPGDAPGRARCARARPAARADGTDHRPDRPAGEGAGPGRQRLE